MTDQAVLELAQQERQVELRGVGMERQHVDFEARHHHLVDEGVLDAEDHLEERHLRQVALGLKRVDEVFERYVLARVDLEHPDANEPAELLEVNRLRFAAHHQRVDETPDQGLQGHVVATRDRCADGKVALAAPAPEQELVRP